MNPTVPCQDRPAVLRKLRWAIGSFICALVLSGITAFPLWSEMDWIAAIRGLEGVSPADAGSGLDCWILTVRDGLRDSYTRHPWLAYGTDWLAFAHLVIAVFFLGAFIDPVRNVWILQAGIIACAMVIPLALIGGAVRQIPLGWRLIDCLFGVLGAIPLIYSLRLAKSLERSSAFPSRSQT
ncbi:MAG: hypothetical protein M1608_17820 [Candidatus Omnitrophica bacterium]|nr:hypothetical protein [Candidatus Omnitrophota bacterium]